MNTRDTKKRENEDENEEEGWWFGMLGFGWMECQYTR
jgi:hypothetical protein